MSSRYLYRQSPYLRPKSITVADTPYQAIVSEAMLVDASGGDVTVLTPVNPFQGQQLTVKKVDSSSNAINVATASATAIESVLFTERNQAVTWVYDPENDNWFLLSNGVAGGGGGGGGDSVGTQYEQLTVTNGVIDPLSEDAILVSQLAINGASYFEGIIAPTNTGRAFSFTAPRTVTWNPDSDPLIFAVNSNDNVVAIYRPVGAGPDVPDIPANLSVDATTTSSITLSWDAVADADTYGLYQSTVSGGPYTLVNDSNVLTFDDTGLVSAITYYYVVDSANAQGRSDKSAEVSGTTGLLPPTGLAVTNTSPTSLTLSWDAVGGAETYGLYQSVGSGGPYVLVNDTNVLTYEDLGLLNNTQYCYVVDSSNAGGRSAQSAPEVCGTTGIALSMPTNGLQLHLVQGDWEIAGGGAPSDGQTVETWNDSSVNSNNATGPGGPSFLAANNSLHFDGSALDTLSNISLVDGENILLVVISPTTDNDFMVITPDYDLGGTDSGSFMINVNPAFGYRVVGTPAPNLRQASWSGGVNPLPGLGVALVEGWSDGSTVELWINGVLNNSNTGLDLGSLGTSDGMRIGGNLISQFIDAEFFEIAIFDGSQTPQERLDARNYLLDKFGIPIP